MKIRTGFVSNSSSSSFIVISGIVDSKDVKITTLDYCVGNNNSGEYKFGWQLDKYTDIYSKLNWSFLIGYYNKMQVIDMIEFIQSALEMENIYFNCDENAVLGLIENGYIDHQSLTRDNALMWESPSTMRLWLLSSKSYIRTDNDNH